MATTRAGLGGPIAALPSTPAAPGAPPAPTHASAVNFTLVGLVR